MKSPTRPRQYSPADFLYGPTLGEGRFGTVIYAELKTDAAADSNNRRRDASNDDSHAPHPKRIEGGGRGYAIKIIPKSEIIRHNQIQAVMTEKQILTGILSFTSDNPLPGSELVMKLFLCFHDASCIYFVLELCAGGTLLDLIQRSASDRIDDGVASQVMDIPWVKYYLGQILRAIEYLHQRGVVHRDITPQNIGITCPSGEIKLGDFGAAALFLKEECEDGTFKLKRWTPATSSIPEILTDFVGTADYVSPEMIRGNGINTNQHKDHSTFPAIDLWSFGCLIYHMFVGKSPFHAANDHLAFQNVLDYANGKTNLDFPPFITDDAKDLISMLLSIDYSSRLGMQDGVIDSIMGDNPGSNEVLIHASLNQYHSIRNHSFFDEDSDNYFRVLEERKFVDTPWKPTQPNWMTDLNQGET
eukprot:CAMPEP_0183740592 /NCGR_PEP_ID=MMETSP0737-20130205/60040_1 /TAXON_ID=385413 /ORGANISM="Thalassiosira miniscula, Strain CCMP1093" /LENGTH=415 /DNA_ID=CAMNT_0025975705 /DNA_START=26 /DNA_END=1269 /DNA_ORIENTATION=-